MPRSRASVVLAMPLCEVNIQIAINQVRSGSFVPSKMVPTLMENRLPHSAHLWVRRSLKV